MLQTWSVMNVRLSWTWSVMKLSVMNVICRPYQFWANVSDLYVTWSKVAVGLVIHKNDKKSWIIVVWRLLCERFHGNNQKKCKISTTQKARTHFFLNEPELTCSYMHLIHFICLFYMFLRHLRFLDFLMILGLSFWLLMLTGTCVKRK